MFGRKIISVMDECADEMGRPKCIRSKFAHKIVNNLKNDCM